MVPTDEWAAITAKVGVGWMVVKPRNGGNAGYGGEAGEGGDDGKGGGPGFAGVGGKAASGGVS